MISRTSFSLLFLVVLQAIGHTVASPLACDTFDYDPDSRLSGQNGGYGWGAAWVSASAKISDEEISYVSEDLTRGGGSSLKLEVDGENVLSRSIGPVPDQSASDYFVSFIFQVKSASETGEISGEVFTGWQCQDSSPSLKIDNIGFTGLHGRAGARVNGLSKLIKTPLQYGTTYFLVIKYGGWDGRQYTNTTVWLNPTSGDEDMADPFIKVKTSADMGSDGFFGVQVRALGLTADKYYLFDDLCVGRTWADVTTAPIKFQP